MKTKDVSAAGVSEVRAPADTTDRSPVGGRRSGQTQPLAQNSGRAPVNILIVDDRQENLAALAAVLEPLGERIVQATSADDALRCVLRQEFAVILLDVRMPGTGGLETARLIKARERSRLTPIIFITAFEEDRRRVTAAYQSGAVDYLFKPLDPEVLRAKVAVFTELFRKGWDAASQRRRRYADEVLRAAVEAERDRVAAVLDSLTDPTSAFDHEWRWTYVNPAAAELLRSIGKDPEALIGHLVWEEAPELLGTRFYSEAIRAQADQQLVEFEDYFARLDRWYETRVVPTEDGFVAHFRDVTARRRAEDAQRVLAGVGSALAGSLELDLILQRLAEATVVGLADWCVIDLVDHEARTVRRAATTHADPAKAEVLRDMSRRYPPEYDRPTLARRVAETGEPEVVPVVTAELMRSAAQDEEHARIAFALGMRSYMVVPLRARDRLVGVIAFVSAQRSYGADDLALAEEVARRAAVAVDNARLYAAEQRAHAEAEEARARAEQANRAKSDFLATMSHELRTPLNAIIGYQELLADGITGSVSEAQREQLTRIKASATHLLSLIDELLTFSRFEVGRERAQREPVDVAAVLEEARAIAWPLAKAKGLGFTVTAPDHPRVIETDHGKLKQILVNLLSNAVKFTERGGVTLVARDDGDAIRFEVQDTGIGIAGENLERIFETFWQVEQSHVRRAGGTGLGLSVTRRLARLLGGDVSVRSEPGAGSTFEVRLPHVSNEAPPDTAQG
jgi:PAS domain S-box-containing protein